MKKVFIIFLFIFSLNNKAIADCITGFACSIADLERKENEKLLRDIEIYKQYLKDNQKDIVLTIHSKPFKYKDLFNLVTFYGGSSSGSP